METPSSHSPLKPRHGLMPLIPSPRAQEDNDMNFTPVVGPSFARSRFDVAGDDGNPPISRMPLNTISSPSEDSRYHDGSICEFGTSTAIFSNTPAARLHALLTHPSDSSCRKSSLTRPFASQISDAGSGSVASRFTPPTPSVIRDSLKDLFSHARHEPGDMSQKSGPRRNSFGISEIDIATVVTRARVRHKGKRTSFSDDDKAMSPPSSLPRQRGSLIPLPPIVFSEDEARLHRTLTSTSAALFCSTPDSPSKASEVQEQKMLPSSTPGQLPLASSSSQDGAEAQTGEADVTFVQDSLANTNCTEMKASRPLEGSGLCTPIPSPSRAKSLPLRTPAPPGAWMSTRKQPTMISEIRSHNGSTDRFKFGSIRRRKSTLKVRFDVTESEASTAEVEHQESSVTAVRISAPDSLPNGHASRVEGVPKEWTNGSSQGDAVDRLVPARPVAPGRRMTPASRANAPPSRPLRKTPSVKVVDAFRRERIDELSIPIANGRAGAKGTIRSSSSAKTPRTLRASNKSKIRIVDAMGREIREGNVPEPSFVENSSVLHDNTPICRTGTLSQIRQTLREWAGGLMSDKDRLTDDLALNTTHLKELEKVSRTSRHARNQLARALRVESVKERDLMHKYAKDAMGRSGLLPTITGDRGSFHRDLVWFGIMLQIIFVLAMWRFAHVQARRLFCTVYYDPLYPELNPLPGHSRRFLSPYPSFPWSLPQAYEVLKHEGWLALKAELQGAVRRVGERAWESWTEPPNAGTWSPT